MRGAVAAFSVAGLSLASLVVGVMIMQAIGVGGARELTGAEQGAALARRPDLLIPAELLKIATGAAIIVAVRALAERLRGSGRVSAIGFAGGVLLIGAGALGLLTVIGRTGATLALPVVVLGLLSLAVTGVWALLAGRAGRREGVLPRGLAWTGAALALLSVGGAVFPPLVFVASAPSLVWWTWLGLVLLRPSCVGTVRAAI